MISKETPVQEETLTTQVSQDKTVLPSPPVVSAQSAIVIEATTGRVLYEKNPNQRAYPASITKIMTALLAIEEGSLDDLMKVPSSASGIEGSSIYLESGESISLRDLVYGLMLRSGNDAALAIAQSIRPSTAEFVAKMNERAVEIGATNTHFINPNGLFEENHYTTAYDMALIARTAMAYPEFRTIVGSKSWEADRGEGKYNYFYNKNKVVFEYPGGNGVKIGYTKASGRTLVASSERDGMLLICVVMTAPNWFQDSYKLMDYVYETNEMKTLASGERVLKAVLVNGGDRDHVMIGPKDPVRCPIKIGTEAEISIAYDVPTSVNAPVSRFQEAGELQIFVGGTFLFSQPLYYLEDVEKMQTP
jgi:D-alanyl-D-alanine carboxypeptidase (penicillin-binding protein 5/6)